jgi:Uncharacterised protein family (UPF0180)
MARVAVEQSLTPISKMLNDNGYDVVPLGNWQQPVDAIVITGQDVNMMGMEEVTNSGAPVISADGLTTNEVFRAVNARLSKTEHH